MTVSEAGNPLPPGAVIGLLGGGQLGRMTAIAAARLGYSTHIFTDRDPSPALEVSARGTVAPFDDGAALDRFSNDISVASFEFENVPLEAIRRVAARVPVYPSVRALEISQDRLAEKEFLNTIGASTVAFESVHDRDSLAETITRIGTPAILKTRREGYDGKGQERIDSLEAGLTAWDKIHPQNGGEAVLEAWAEFATEISVIVVRKANGKSATYDPVENLHEDGILTASRVPAAVSEKTADEARAISIRVAEALDYEGVLAVEMFLFADGRLLVNEIAPRPHNSGHWTIDAAETSQFEQQVRICAGLPLGSVHRISDAVMQNLIGEDVSRWPEFVRQGTDRLHLYGKDECRPGRKMGHVTRLFPLGKVPGEFDIEAFR